MHLQTQVALGRIGSLSQLGSLLLIALFLGALYRSQPDRPYFTRWVLGWGMFAASLLAISVRYSAFESPGGGAFGTLSEHAGTTRVLYLVYATAKVSCLALMTAGVRAFVGGVPGGTSRLWAVALAGAVAGAALLAMSPTLNRFMSWQSGLAVVAFGSCAHRILTLEASRRTLGTRALGLAFAAHALLWVVYGILFSVTIQRLSWILTFNSYIDAVMQTMLAYGMVLVVMEETSREARTALHELEAAHVALRRAAYSDPLTGTWNRQAFAEGLGLDALGLSGGTVVLLDVDNLKPVNDSFGHGAGDELIRRMASVLASVTEPQDAIYRWGGDEFLLVLPRRSATAVRQLLAPLVGGGQTVTVGGVTIPVRASFGCAVASDRGDLGRAVAEADREMYQTKGASRMATVSMLTDLPSATVR